MYRLSLFARRNPVLSQCLIAGFSILSVGLAIILGYLLDPFLPARWIYPAVIVLTAVVAFLIFLYPRKIDFANGRTYLRVRRPFNVGIYTGGMMLSILLGLELGQIPQQQISSSSVSAGGMIHRVASRAPVRQFRPAQTLLADMFETHTNGSIVQKMKRLKTRHKRASAVKRALGYMAIIAALLGFGVGVAGLSCFVGCISTPFYEVLILSLGVGGLIWAGTSFYLGIFFKGANKMERLGAGILNIMGLFSITALMLPYVGWSLPFLGMWVPWLVVGIALVLAVFGGLRYAKRLRSQETS